MPANTFIATAEAASRIGAVPVLVDVDPEYLLIDPSKVAAAMTRRTQAIVPVHLFGQTAFVEQLGPRVRGWRADRGGRRTGARCPPLRSDRPAGLVVAAATSFYPGKNLGAAGDAGAVTTDDPDDRQRVRLLGSHGSPTSTSIDSSGSTRGSTRCRRWCCMPSWPGWRSGTRCAVRRPRGMPSCSPT